MGKNFCVGLLFQLCIHIKGDAAFDLLKLNKKMQIRENLSKLIIPVYLNDKSTGRIN